VIVLAIAAFVFFNPKVLQSWRKADAAQAGSHSIAVLPFENASGDPNAEYLSEGISEALINSLTELQQLRVIARSTAFHYKGKDVDPRRIGRELHVAAVLTGRVRQMQDALSVQVDLVDAITGAQLWGTAYDRKISDVVAVKQAIAREVTQKLKLRLTGEEERRLVKRDTTNAEAYQSRPARALFWNQRTPNGLKQADRGISKGDRARSKFRSRLCRIGRYLPVTPAVCRRSFERGDAESAGSGGSCSPD
jgi:TolB-like protein